MNTAKHTLHELRMRAIDAIEREDDIAVEAIEEDGQIFDNVKHMQWAIKAVMLALADEHPGTWGGILPCPCGAGKLYDGHACQP